MSKMPLTQSIGLEQLSQYFHLPINAVAKELGVCATVLKKICRRNGIPRWPHRKIKSLDKMISTLENTVPKNSEDEERIKQEIATLKNKKKFLILNPNVLVKTKKTHTPAKKKRKTTKKGAKEIEIEEPEEQESSEEAALASSWKEGPFSKNELFDLTSTLSDALLMKPGPLQQLPTVPMPCAPPNMGVTRNMMGKQHQMMAWPMPFQTKQTPHMYPHPYPAPSAHLVSAKGNSSAFSVSPKLPELTADEHAAAIYHHHHHHHHQNAMLAAAHSASASGSGVCGSRPMASAKFETLEPSGYMINPVLFTTQEGVHPLKHTANGQPSDDWKDKMPSWYTSDLAQGVDKSCTLSVVQNGDDVDGAMGPMVGPAMHGEDLSDHDAGGAGSGSGSGGSGANVAGSSAVGGAGNGTISSPTSAASDNEPPSLFTTGADTGDDLLDALDTSSFLS